MTAKRSPNERSFGFWEEQTHITSVPCPEPPDGCGMPAGTKCVQPSGKESTESHFPGHWRRIRDADKANPAGARPALPPEPERPSPGRHLVPADRVRRDLASYREPCGHCHRSVVWVTNERNDRLPVDPEPTSDGVLVLTVDDRGVRSARLNERQAAGAREHGKGLHVPHRETCPKGDRWSRHHPSRK